MKYITIFNVPRWANNLLKTVIWLLGQMLLGKKVTVEVEFYRTQAVFENNTEDYWDE